MDQMVVPWKKLLQYHLHLSIGMIPFKALHGYDAPSFNDSVFWDKKAHIANDWIQESKDSLRVLKENIHDAQNRQNMYIDQHRIEHNFEVGDLIFLRLQTYRQSTLKKSGAENMKPRFHGPYKVLQRIGEVAYELELPRDNEIHNVFYVSCLKKVLGQHVTTFIELPPLDEEGKLELIMDTIMIMQENNLRGRLIIEYLIRWKNLPEEDTTWEGERILQHLNLQLLEGKKFSIGGLYCPLQIKDEWRM